MPAGWLAADGSIGFRSNRNPLSDRCRELAWLGPLHRTAAGAGSYFPAPFALVLC